MGVYASDRLPYGPKQCPAIYQSIQDEIFGPLEKPTGEPLAEIFVDDTYVGDLTLEAQFESLIQLLTKAREHGIQYRFIKSKVGMPDITLLGFNMGKIITT